MMDSQQFHSPGEEHNCEINAGGISVPAQITGMITIMLGILTMIAGIALLAFYVILLMIQLFFGASGNQVPLPGMRELLMLLMWIGVIIVGFIIMRIGYRIRKPHRDRATL